MSNLKLIFKGFFTEHRLRRILQYGLYMLIVLLCQNMFFSELRLLGVCPMILPAAAVAVGMFEGATWGAVFSLIMGIFSDMAFVENTIAFTVLLPLLAFGAGFVSQFFINRRFFAYMLTAVAGLLITGLFQMEMVALADQFSLSMLTTVLWQTLWSLPAAVLEYFPPARWIE